MQGSRQDLPSSWIKKSTFLQVFFRVPSKPLRKQVSQAIVPGWGFLSVCSGVFFAGQYSRFFVTKKFLKASLYTNKPSLRKRPHSKLPIGIKYLSIILVFEKWAQKIKSVETPTPKTGSAVPTPDTALCQGPGICSTTACVIHLYAILACWILEVTEKKLTRLNGPLMWLTE